MFESNRVGSNSDPQEHSDKNENATAAGLPALQREIIAYFVPHNEPKTVYSAAPDPAVDRKKFFEMLSNGEITRVEENNYLLTLPSPLTKDNLNEFFAKVTANPREKQILASLVGYHIGNWQDVKPHDLAKFLRKPHRGEPDYRTPVGFAELRQAFLAEIRPKGPAELFDEYIASMDNLERNLYGIRLDYFNAFEDFYKQITSLDQTPILRHQSLAALTDPNQTVQVAKNVKSVAPPPPSPDVPNAPAAPAEVPETPQFHTQVSSIPSTMQVNETPSAPRPQANVTNGAPVPAAAAPIPGPINAMPVMAEAAGATSSQPIAQTYFEQQPTVVPTPSPEPTQPATSPSSTPSFSFTPIADERREQVISHANIEADAWRQNGQDYRLSVANLVNAGLAPNYELSIEGRTFYLSNVFPLPSEQSAAIAYVQSPEGIIVRSFYRDKQQALWRYLPDYIRDISGEGIDAFGVGFDERSTILPIALQAALNQIEKHNGLYEITATNPDFLFAGTAHAYNTRQEFRDTYGRGALRGDFYHEVSSRALNFDASNLISPTRRKTAPQLLSINNRVAPNFYQLFARFTTYSAFAGQCMGEGFPSNDGETSWLFMSDYRARCWVANIETHSPITSTGCRREWLLPTDIVTPLYELVRLADSYGDPGDTRAGAYISMWNNYISKIPLIGQYVDFLKSQQNPNAE